MQALHNLLTLGRVSNLPTVWSNCLAAWVVNRYASRTDLLDLQGKEGDLLPPWEPMLWLMFGASLVYLAGCTLNDAFDQEFDKRHNPQRPIPSGATSARTVWLIGFVELGLGIFILLQLCQVDWVWLLLLALVILLYDAIHKKWKGSVWLMGSCRFFLWLTAASAANPQIATLTFSWAGIVALYVVGISLFARGEATGETTSKVFPIPLLFGPFVFAVYLLLAANQSPVPAATLACMFGALVSGRLVLFGFRNVKSGESGGIGKGVSLLLAGIAAGDAAAAGLLFPTMGWACLACVPIALLLQKRFAAT